MPKIKVDGREYEWPDPSTVTFREAKMIKERLGLSQLQMLQQLSQGVVDEEMILAMFVLAKVRSDGDVDIDKLLDLPLIGIELVADDEEVQAEEEAPLADSKKPSEEKPKNVTKRTTSKTT